MVLHWKLQLVKLVHHHDHADLLQPTVVHPPIARKTLLIKQNSFQFGSAEKRWRLVNENQAWLDIKL